jgi:hypothetical protein
MRRASQSIQADSCHEFPPPPMRQYTPNRNQIFDQLYFKKIPEQWKKIVSPLTRAFPSHINSHRWLGVTKNLIWYTNEYKRAIEAF